MCQKFDMAALKKVAEEKFTSALKSIAGTVPRDAIHRQVLAVVSFIYESTPEKDRGLRDLVVAYVAKCWKECLKLPEFKDFVAGNIDFFVETVEARVPARVACTRCEATEGVKIESVSCGCGHYGRPAF